MKAMLDGWRGWGEGFFLLYVCGGRRRRGGGGGGGGAWDGDIAYLIITHEQIEYIKEVS